MATAGTVPSQDLEAVRREFRSHIKWERDCAKAMIASGSVIGFGLILSGAAIRREMYVPLLAAYGALLLVNAYFWARATRAIGQAEFGNVLNAFVPPVLIIFAAIGRASGNWPIRAYSSQWWQVVGLAFLVVILGTYRRRKAEDILDQLNERRT